MAATPNVLKQADIFYQLSQEQLEAVAALCREARFANGETVFNEGSRSDDLYIVIEGEVDILINPGLVGEESKGRPEPVIVSTMRRGQSFGEIALVDQGLRSATARVVTAQARMYVIPGRALLELCEREAQLGYLLMRNLAADLGFKIRNSDLNLRGSLLYKNHR
ncbi:MAG: cyclic nucleotide-binding domain-containing protein [Chloroflexi bacterium]|nr:cyclic nucleotide-binding domain-containing protein [Chloroflexota bacterium]